MKNNYLAGTILLLVTFIGALFSTMNYETASSLGFVGSAVKSDNHKSETGKKVDENSFAGLVEKRNMEIRCIEEKYSVTIIQADYLFDMYTFTASSAKFPAGGEMKDFKGPQMEKICGY